METRLIIGIIFIAFQVNLRIVFGVPAHQCGAFVKKPTREAKIVGGSDCFEGEFPWMVSLKSKMGHFCGGFLISDQHVLSAAHCFWESANKYIDYENGKVVLSSLNATIGEFSLKSLEHTKDITIPIEALIVHPNYNPATKDNDIALIKLKNKISIHPVAKPVCLPGSPRSNSNNGTMTYEKAIAAGWGKTDMYQDFYDWEENVDALKKVEVKIWDSEKCRDVYKGFGKFPKKSFICAGQKGRDSCTGDSGGPLMRLEGHKWTAIGVVSVGNKCGDLGRPGIYTDVSSHLDFIYSNMK